MVDIEQLRQFRVMNLNSNWMKDLRTEVFRRMYDEPIHPANLWLEQDPKRHADVDEVYRDNIRRLIDRGTFTPPAVRPPGREVRADGGWVEDPGRGVAGDEGALVRLGVRVARGLVVARPYEKGGGPGWGPLPRFAFGSR